MGFLAPDPRLAPGGMAEVRAAVAALHAAGIGVILDMVFNHSGEGDELGPTLSLRGLGNAAWYRLQRFDPRRYVNDSGCGNTLALDRPWGLRLAMDALRHWVLQAGMDGFRFSLATTLGRRPDGFDPQAPLLAAIRQDPLLRHRVMIAEPWDIGHRGYRLANSPPAGANGTTASATMSGASGAAMPAGWVRWRRGSPVRRDLRRAATAGGGQHQLHRRA